jgi:L-rhamnonate dehydratase
LHSEGLETLIADGEGQASPSLLDWAKEGVIDVVQYDIFSYGFTPWLVLGHTSLDEWGVRSAPHHYGRYYGNYATPHLAAALRGFAFVEWDEATVPGLPAPAYQIVEGEVIVPDRPGFGVELDEELFARAIATGGGTVTL